MDKVAVVGCGAYGQRVFCDYKEASENIHFGNHEFVKGEPP